MMNRVCSFLRRSLLLLAVVAFAFPALALAASANAAAKQDKHARKIEKKLEKYRAGTFLQVELNDNTEARGSLGKLFNTTFELNNADTNTVQSIKYSDVDTVNKTKQYIGAGAEPSHHMHLPWP